MKFISIGVVTILCFLVGCNSNSHVTGKVTFEDETPLTQGIVIFDNGTTLAKGPLDSNGNYSLGSLTPKDGVPNGNYKVYLTGTTQSGKIGPRGQLLEPPKELVDPGFTKSETSGLTCDVKGNTTFNITVKPPNKR